MADYKPMIKTEELNFERMLSAFAGKRHKVWMVYDEEMDELVAQLVEPSFLVATHYIDNEIAYLVDTNTHEVVGIRFLNYQQFHLPQDKKSEEVWYSMKIYQQLNSFQEFTYEPSIEPEQIKRDISHMFSGDIGNKNKPQRIYA